MIKALLIVILTLYLSAVLGFVSAWIAEKIVKTDEKKEIARELKEGFLFFFCLPYWLYRRCKKKAKQ